MSNLVDRRHNAAFQVESAYDDAEQRYSAGAIRLTSETFQPLDYVARSVVLDTIPPELYPELAGAPPQVIAQRTQEYNAALSLLPIDRRVYRSSVRRPRVLFERWHGFYESPHT